MKGCAESLIHPFPPTWDEKSEILILGSFPSVKSREMAYYYGHPQNRFWRVAAILYSDAVPQTVEERRSFLLRHHIALWDVIASCTEETELVEGLGLNSVGILYLVISIEETFQIRFENAGIADFRTVGDVITYIQKKLDEKA